MPQRGELLPPECSRRELAAILLPWAPTNTCWIARPDPEADPEAGALRCRPVDMVESADLKQVEKAAMIIRTYGHSTTETLVATPWKEFVAML